MTQLTLVAAGEGASRELLCWRRPLFFVVMHPTGFSRIYFIHGRYVLYLEMCTVLAFMND